MTTKSNSGNRLLDNDVLGIVDYLPVAWSGGHVTSEAPAWWGVAG
jgi:hypothetical protein